MNTSQIIAAHVVQTTYDNLPARSIERAKWRILDSLGNISIGWRGEGVSSLYNLITRHGGSEDATLCVYGGKAPTAEAAMLNSMLLRAYDFEACLGEGENGRRCTGHISGSTFPAAFSSVEAAQGSGKDLLLALILADDVTSRTLASFEFSLYGYFDNTGTANGLGATAAAIKAFGLNEEQALDAFGIAVNSFAGTMQNVFEGNACFKYPMANAARSGIYAAELAREGYGSLADPIAGERCFFDIYSHNNDTTHLTENIGQDFYADLVIKPWPCCRATHPMTWGTLLCTGGKPLNPDEVDSIVITTHPENIGFTGQDFAFGKASATQGAFNYVFTSAVAALRGDVKPIDFEPDRMNDPQLGKMIEKITVIPTEEEFYIDGTKVDIKMKDGTVLSASPDDPYPLGDIISNPLSDSQVIDKFLSNTEYSGFISKANSNQIIDFVMNLEQKDSLAELIPLVVR